MPVKFLYEEISSSFCIEEFQIHWGHSSWGSVHTHTPVLPRAQPLPKEDSTKEASCFFCSLPSWALNNTIYSLLSLSSLLTCLCLAENSKKGRGFFYASTNMLEEEDYIYTAVFVVIYSMKYFTWKLSVATHPTTDLKHSTWHLAVPQGAGKAVHHCAEGQERRFRQQKSLSEFLTRRHFWQYCFHEENTLCLLQMLQDHTLESVLFFQATMWAVTQPIQWSLAPHLVEQQQAWAQHTTWRQDLQVSVLNRFLVEYQFLMEFLSLNP